MSQRVEPTAWVGWVLFGATMMLIIGIMHVIAGLVGLFNSDFYVGTSAGVIVFDITTWGWIHIVTGILLVATSIGIVTRTTWARISGVLLTSIAIVVNIAFLPTYPLWSLIGITLGCFVVYALAMHGNEIEE